MELIKIYKISNIVIKNIVKKQESRGIELFRWLMMSLQLGALERVKLGETNTVYPSKLMMRNTFEWCYKIYLDV